MRGVLLIAHGSKRDSANREVHALADKLQQKFEGFASNERTLVSCCFLELAEPSIPAGLSFLIEAGAKNIQVLPYFLTQGRHVIEDIPAILNRYIEQHGNNGDITLETLPYLGADNRLLDSMMDLIDSDNTAMF
jgi:sirohydrochlorin ferrochelatase